MYNFTGKRKKYFIVEFSSKCELRSKSLLKNYWRLRVSLNRINKHCGVNNIIMEPVLIAISHSRVTN